MKIVKRRMRLDQYNSSVLSLDDFTGNMVEPWLKAGYGCRIVDLRHPRGELRDGRLTRIGVDIMCWEPQPCGLQRIVFATPPCTHLASSGARWWAGKGLRPLIEALTHIQRCIEICKASGAPWMIENPVGRLSTIWRKPDYTFDPCDFGGYLDPPGDAYTKRTCLWTGGGFIMPEPIRIEPVSQSENPISQARISPDRGFKRSITPLGFAQAVFLANSG